MTKLYEFGNGVYAIDSGYERPLLAAVHFIVEGGAVAIVDTAANSSVPRILEGLAALGRSPADVQYVMLTHVHLDHAGGAGRLMALCPDARLTVHPRGARHMADPSTLWQATVDVYGAGYATQVYGTIVPVPIERVIETPDDASVTLGSGRTLRFLDTPGHARHHVAIQDGPRIFTGDVFGISYRELDQDGRPFIFPTSSPSQFEPRAAHRSIDRIVALEPEAVYLTHFSEVRDVPRLAGIMHRLLDAYVAVARANAAPSPGRQQALREGLFAAIIAEGRAQGLRHDEAFYRRYLELDAELNAQGLAMWLDGGANG